MTATTLSTYGKCFLGKLRYWIFRTPLTALVAFTVVSLELKEEYPFSNFPMYADPSPGQPYYSITDGEGNPIPVSPMTGISTSKIGKMYRQKLKEHAKELNVDDKEIPQAEIQKLAEEIFSYLREKNGNRPAQLPDKLQLLRNNIQFDPHTGKISETHEVLARE